MFIWQLVRLLDWCNRDSLISNWYWCNFTLFSRNAFSWRRVLPPLNRCIFQFNHSQTVGYYSIRNKCFTHSYICTPSPSASILWGCTHRVWMEQYCGLGTFRQGSSYWQRQLCPLIRQRQTKWKDIYWLKDFTLYTHFDEVNEYAYSSEDHHHISLCIVL